MIRWWRNYLLRKEQRKALNEHKANARRLGMYCAECGFFLKMTTETLLQDSDPMCPDCGSRIRMDHDIATIKEAIKEMQEKIKPKTGEDHDK